MITIDCHPFSIVEDGGFAQLLSTLESRYTFPSRRYMTETVPPCIKEGVAAQARREMACVEQFSFTTGTWSTEVNNDALLSLTAHWLTESMKRKSAVLHAQTFRGSHTGEAICEKYKEMLAGWGIRKE